MRYFDRREMRSAIDYSVAVRLEKTARRLGVRVIVIHRPGERGQPVDLCSVPLTRAVKEATLE